MKELLFSIGPKDCEFEFYRGTGAGGQKRNKTSSACRCTHKASGAQACSEAFREQHKNKADAFTKMAKTEKFQKWVRLECLRQSGELAAIESKVEREMAKIKVEVQYEGRWVEE